MNPTPRRVVDTANLKRTVSQLAVTCPTCDANVGMRFEWWVGRTKTGMQWVGDCTACGSEVGAFFERTETTVFPASQTLSQGGNECHT